MSRRNPTTWASVSTDTTRKSIDLGRLERVDGRYDDALEARASRRDRDRQDAGRRHELALERELPGQRVPRQPVRRHLSGRGEDPGGDRQVEAGALLAQGAWRQVDDDPPERPLELLALDGRTDALAGVANAGARQARERERRADRGRRAPRR